jgi:hypothetical protein
MCNKIVTCGSCTENDCNKTEETGVRETTHEVAWPIHLGGKDPLSKSETGKLYNYCGSAIRRSVNSFEVMKTTVWAIFFPKLSTNDKPQHGLHTSDDDSWCKFKSYASSRVAYEHKHFLPPALMDTIKPLFKDLASVHLHVKTQNANVWTQYFGHGYSKLLLHDSVHSGMGYMMQSCISVMVQQRPVMCWT